MIWLILLFWCAASIINFGALNAYERANWRWTREAAGISALVSVLPVVGILFSIFLTGFCEHGFSWRIGGKCPLCGSPLKAMVEHRCSNGIREEEPLNVARSQPDAKP